MCTITVKGVVCIECKTESFIPKQWGGCGASNCLQREFIARDKRDGIESALNWLRPLKKGRELSHPEPVRFVWETDSAESVLELSEDENFANARTFICKDTTVELDNLLAGQKYYWRVNGCAPFWFETADAYPRFIRLDGAHNVRDMGGEKSELSFVNNRAPLKTDFRRSAESFAPTMQFEKLEIHPVFLRFPNFYLCQNLTAPI